MPAKKTSTKKTANKSDFIRQQPSALSGPEVVAKGKAAGIEFSSQLVYNVRGGSKAMKGTVKKTTTPAKSAAPSKAAPAQSKADFVRAHANLSPKDIVAKAKAEGLKLDVTYVYGVRAYDKMAAKNKRGSTARATTTRKAPAVSRPITTSTKAETLLRAVAAEIGLGRAMEILSAERAMVRAVIGTG
jgi:hypothetical protein